MTRMDLSALFTACARDRTAAGARDAAVVMSLYTADMTCKELVAVRLRDWTPASIVVNRATDRERRVLLGQRTANALCVWVTLRGRSPGSLFVGVGRDDAVGHAPLVRESVSRMLVKRSGLVGLEPGRARDLRRTATEDLFEAGAG